MPSGSICEEEAIRKLRVMKKNEVDRGRTQLSQRTAGMRTWTAKVHRTSHETKKSTWMDSIKSTQQEEDFIMKLEVWQDKPAWEELAGEETELKIY